MLSWGCFHHYRQQLVIPMQPALYPATHVAASPSPHVPLQSTLGPQGGTGESHPHKTGGGAERVEGEEARGAKLMRGPPRTPTPIPDLPPPSPPPPPVEETLFCLEAVGFFFETPCVLTCCPPAAAAANVYECVDSESGQP